MRPAGAGRSLRGQSHAATDAMALRLACPLGGREAAQDKLVAGQFAVVPGGAHGVIADGCVPLVVAQFVADGSARGLDATCVGRFEPPPFAISSP